jgi:hypothetical protein
MIVTLNPTAAAFRPLSSMAVRSGLSAMASPFVPSESSSNDGDQPQDPILWAMQATINEMGKQDIKVFEPNSEVQAIEDSLPPRSNPYDIKLYKMMFKGEYEPSLEIDVKLSLSGSPPSGETIHTYEAKETE